MPVNVNGGPSGLTCTVQVAFTTNPADPPTWVDVSADVITFAIDRGRNHELDKIAAGTLTLSLKNTSGNYDPNNSAGPYYGYLLPMRRIQVGFTLASTTYWLFSGYVERWPRTRRGPSWAQVDLQASDAFTLFQNSILSSSPVQQLSGARIGWALDQISWPAGDRAIAAGQAQIQAQTIVAADKVDALTQMQDVETSELGEVFMSGAGKVVFLDRHSLITAPYTASNATFSDKPTGSEIGYTNIVPSLDVDLVVNDWIGTIAGGTTQEVQDGTSVSKYFLRSQTRNTLLTTNSEQAEQLQYLLASTKDAFERFEELTFKPEISTTAWTQMLARDLFDKLTVKEHAPGVSAATVQDVSIQHIHIEGGPGPAGTFTCTYGLYPAALTSYMVLDDPIQGRLDDNSLAY